MAARVQHRLPTAAPARTVPSGKRRPLVRPLALPLLVCGLFLLGAACAAGDGPAGPEDNARVLGPAGGTLALLDGVVSVVVEAGQLAEATRFTAAASTDHPGSARLVPGTAVRVDADPAPPGPLLLVVRYPPAAVPTQLRPGELRLFRLEAGFWRALEGTHGPDGDRIQGVVTLPATLAVLGVPPASVEVLPAQVRMAPGERHTLAAVVRDAAGTVLPGRAVTWLTSKPTVAQVDDFGVVTAVAPGIAHIGAVAESATGSNSIVVEAGG